MSRKRRTVSWIVTAFIGSHLFLAHVQGQTPWWNDAVFYEVFVRSFYDSNGDGTGDLQGLITKLDYLNDGDPSTTRDLGVTGIWLMPIFPSPSYHGYDVTDYRGINPDYGTRQLFQALIDSAHVRGIRVVIDLVLNHTSSQHPWFLQSSSGSASPYRDWYIWRSTDPGYRGPWGQQVWYWNNGAYYFGLFWSGMPDLNYATPAVTSTMFDVSRFWLDTMKVDGFRLDAAKHIFEDGSAMENVPATFSFLREFRQFTKSVKSDVMNVGEVWSPTAQVAPYVDGTGLDFCFEFQLASTIIDAVKSGQPDSVDAQMRRIVRSYPALQYATFLTNHDQDRIFGQLAADNNKMKLAAALLLTLPGIPFVYYGEEVGMTGSGADENKRTPMQWDATGNAGFTTGTPWRPVNPGFALANVQAMQNDSLSLWSWYRALIAARNGHRSLRTGEYASVPTTSTSLLAFARRLDPEIAVVLHNFRNTSVTNPALSLDSSGLGAGAYTVADMLSGDSIGVVTINSRGGFAGWTGNIVVPPYGSILLTVDTLHRIMNSVAERGGGVPGYWLGQNFPNPFNPSTTIPYGLTGRSHVELTVINLLGQAVAELVRGEQEAGYHEVRFGGVDLPSGVYFYRLRVRGSDSAPARPGDGGGDFVQTRKFLLLR